MRRALRWIDLGRSADAATAALMRVVAVIVPLFCATTAVTTSATDPDAAPLAVGASAMVAISASATLRLAVRRPGSVACLIAWGMTLLIVLAPMWWLPARWSVQLELVAALALVALPGWWRAVSWVVIVGALLPLVARDPSLPPAAFAVGAGMLSLFVAVPLLMLRSRRRRAAALDALLDFSESEVRRRRTQEILFGLDELATGPIDAAAIRVVHERVRAGARTTDHTRLVALEKDVPARLHDLGVLALFALPTAASIVVANSSTDVGWGVHLWWPAVVALTVAIGAAWMLTVRTRRWGGFALLAALAAFAIVVVGGAWLGSVVYLVAALLTLGSRAVRVTSIVALLLFAVALVPAGVYLGGVTVVDAIIGAVVFLPLIGFAAALGLAPVFVTATREARDLERLLVRLRSESSARALAEESHDLLGQSLAAAALHADLAKRVADADPSHDVEARALLARAAREARALQASAPVLDTDLEIANAARILQSAGVHVEVDGVHHSPAVLAWAVREGVTNVLRHSDARRVSIRTLAVEDRIVLRIENDRAREAEAHAKGGLARLSERLARAGGTLETGRDGGRFWLEAAAASPHPPAEARVASKAVRQ